MAKRTQDISNNQESNGKIFRISENNKNTFKVSKAVYQKMV